MILGIFIGVALVIGILAFNGWEPNDNFDKNDHDFRI